MRILTVAAHPFRRVRVGEGGRPFTLLKFRTMVVGADRLAATVSPEGDPRVTPVGRLFRRWYVDELPQLVNVVRGDMSLVGARPETLEFAARWSPEERRVLGVKPGLVGPATLSFMDEAAHLGAADGAVAHYVDTVRHARVRADLEYLDRASFSYDLGLLVRQAVAILRS